MQSKSLNSKLSQVKLLVMDVDGTLTDSSMYYTANGEELKRFSTRDGMGIALLHKSNIDTAIVTSEDSEIARARARKLNIEHVVTGCRDKLSALKELTENLSISLENIAYIGDDINDLHAIRVSGVSGCPSDAVKIIKESADYICKAKGGRGAVREFAELILKSQNKSIILPENW